jgi:hypothetical protein
MPVLRFLGRVLPEAITADFPDIPRTNWGADDLGHPIIMSARISQSKIELICEVPAFQEAHLSVLLGRAYNLVDAYVDATAFATGIGMFTDLFAVQTPDGKLNTISREHVELPPLCTAYKIPPLVPEQQKDFTDVMALILGEPNLLGSINDLAQTLMDFHVTPTNCGRVLDSLRRAVAPSLKKEEGWLLLQQIVNAQGDYLKWVSAYSADPRHGDRETPIDKEVVNEMRKRAWTIMNRMLEYRKGANKALDKTKFPLLVHDPSFPFPKP